MQCCQQTANVTYIAMQVTLVVCWQHTGMPGSVTIIDKKAGEQGPEIWLDAYLLAPERA